MGHGDMQKGYSVYGQLLVHTDVIHFRNMAPFSVSKWYVTRHYKIFKKNIAYCVASNYNYSCENVNSIAYRFLRKCQNGWLFGCC